MALKAKKTIVQSAEVEQSSSSESESEQNSDVGEMPPTSSDKEKNSTDATENTDEAMKSTVFIGIHPKTKKEQIRAFFSKLEINTIRFIPKHRCVFVRFSNPEAVEAALKLDGQIIYKTPARIERAKTKRNEKKNLKRQSDSKDEHQGEKKPRNNKAIPKRAQQSANKPGQFVKIKQAI